MTKFKAWISAARLRTLPLSVSGVLTGSGLAIGDGNSNGFLLFLALLTTIAYQITSNFANDYGDGVKGTDNAERIGPERALQSGSLSRKELKLGIVFTAALSFIFTLAAVLEAFGSEALLLLGIFLILGLLSIWASIRYTVGDSPYGYRGLGDLFVFCFFGLLSVLGSYYLFAKSWHWGLIFPAITIGTLSTAVLNLNNLRDLNSDKNSGKNTLVVQRGFRWGKGYHLTLLLLAFVSMLIFIYLQGITPYRLLYLLPFVVLTLHGLKVMRCESPILLDPELKKVALLTFVLSLLIYLGNNYFL